MSKGKVIQAGVQVNLADGMNWHALAALSPDETKNRDVFPQGFMPLPHVNHAVGGMVFPKFSIDEIRRQEDRDLTRFDADFDLPEHFRFTPNCGCDAGLGFSSMVVGRS